MTRRPPTRGAPGGADVRARSDPRPERSPGARCSRARPWPASAPSWRRAARRPSPSRPRRPRRRADRVPGAAAAHREADSPSDVLNFANWPLYIDQDEGNPPKSPTLEQFTAKYGTEGQLRRGRQRQRHVLRHDPAAAPGRPGHRLGHRRPDRLDGSAPHPPRLGRDDRHRQHAQLRGQPERRLQGRPLGSGQQPARAVAVRHDRAGLRRGDDRRRSPALDSLWTDDPRWKGKRLVPHRDARHGRPHAAEARLQSPRTSPRQARRGVRRDPEGRRRRDRPQLPRQRVQGGPRQGRPRPRHGVVGRHHPGASSRRPACSSSSRTRAGCSGPTTCRSRRAPSTSTPPS